MTSTTAARAERSTSNDANRTMDGLRKIVRALRSGNTQAERSLGISSAQLFALRAIAAQPGGSLLDVAHRTLTSQSSVSEVVSRLVGAQLVSRQPSIEDRRRLELNATEKGKRLLKRAPQTVQERLAAALLALPSDQRTALADGMDAWMEAAGFAGILPGMFFEEESTPGV